MEAGKYFSRLGQSAIGSYLSRVCKMQLGRFCCSGRAGRKPQGPYAFYHANSKEPSFDMTHVICRP
jgi:hypothetical protein